MADIVTSTILTILGSGFGAGVMTFILNSLKADRDFRRAKLEELYAGVHGYMVDLPVISFRQRTGKPVTEEEMEALNENVGRIDMLVNLYFPELLPVLKQFRAAERSLSEQDYRSGQPGEEDVLVVIEEGMKLEAAVVSIARRNKMLYVY